MNEEEREYVLTENQDRLLSIAGWAKNLASIALIFYIVLAILVIPQDMVFYQRFSQITNPADYWNLMSSNKMQYIANIGADVFSRLLSGAIYYVVLKGISLGLYMVIETDINYREKERGEENHE